MPSRHPSSPPSPSLRPLEDRLPVPQDLIQRLLEVRRRLGEILPHLLHVLLPALADLFLELLLDGPRLEGIAPLGGVIDHHVRDQRPREAACLLGRILGEEGIDRASTCRGTRS